MFLIKITTPPFPYATTPTGPYRYTTDLLAIAACINPRSLHLPSALCKITTPLSLSAWQTCLALHPDQEYARYILDGIANGFRIGFAYTALTNRNSATSNHPSANEHPTLYPMAYSMKSKKADWLAL